LRSFVLSGKRSALVMTRARILLLTDPGEHGHGREDRRVAEALGRAHRTVEGICKRCVTDGLDAALTYKPQTWPRRERVLDGAAKAKGLDESSCNLLSHTLESRMSPSTLQLWLP
jgi:hypothetical protein